MTRVTLKPKGMRRFKKKHPWIFRDDLRVPREAEVGLHDLYDDEGHWLAKGILNPSSKIAFRVMLDNENTETEATAVFLENIIGRAIQERQKWLYQNISCRLIHGESDHLSGLIADLFFSQEKVILVVQSQSAGMDTLLGEIQQVLEKWIQEFSSTKKLSHEILIKNDSSKRAREGLETKATEALSGSQDSKPVLIRVGSIHHPEMLTEMKANLWTGQKTGFFLDQSFNIDVVFEFALKVKRAGAIRLLDICSYVGQWSARLSKGLSSRGFDVDCTAIDASEAALSLARENLKLQGAGLKTVRCDVFQSSWEVEEGAFDIIICDPPALIKSRKDLEVGKHAYTKLNALALKKCAKDALFVTCSCSGILTRDDFRKVLQSAVQRSGRRVLWVGEGRQSTDHPVRDWFPEGEYLKCFLARVLD